MTSRALPPWPLTSPAFGKVDLRSVEPRDAAMAQELSTDPYVPLTGSLPADASRGDALAWVRRQQSRHEEGAGFSFAIAEANTDDAVGHCGLWLRGLSEGTATAGYAIVPAQRRRGFATDAVRALTVFGWTMPSLQRIDLFIEPWNVASLRVAENAGYTRVQRLSAHREIGGEYRDMVLCRATRPETRL